MKSLVDILQNIKPNIEKTNLQKPLKKVKKQRKITTRTNNRNSFIAVQHNGLVEAKYTMTLQQKRIMIWLTSQIKPTDEDFKQHTLSVKELIEICNLSGESAYKEVRNITFSLIEKGIRIFDLTDPKNETEIQVAWLCSAVYKDGAVSLKFAPELKPYLLKLKDRFTAIKMVDLMRFSSIHAIRIYELLKQYQNIGERILSIEELKDCCGVKDKLKQYIEFERRLLLIAQREINEKSDIKFEFERIKHLRKIVAIKFIITQNKAYESRNNPDKQLQEVKRTPPIAIILRDFGLSTRMINTLLKENSETTLQNAVNAVDVQLKKEQVRNAKAMLLVAIKEKWHPEKYKQR
jgi:plasmid replication initiation protein